MRSVESSASSCYDVYIEPARGLRGWSMAGLQVTLLATWALSGWWDEFRVGDLVVTRTADGREVLRTSAGAQSDVALSLTHVREQLEYLSVPDFEDAWGIPSDAQDPV
ncbi:MAG: hypothetical protein ACR2JD_01260 [Nocardioides sp.]